MCFRQRSKPGPSLEVDSYIDEVPAWVNRENWDAVQQEVLGYKKDREHQFLDSYPVAQELGKVDIPTGRLVAFPSLFQYRTAGFKTKDNTKPGHCKVLSLFLVDPHIRIISTANVPPQRKDWWTDRECVICFVLRQRMPQELVNMVLLELDRIERCPISKGMESCLKARMKRERNRIRNVNREEIETPPDGWNLGGTWSSFEQGAPWNGEDQATYFHYLFDMIPHYHH